MALRILRLCIAPRWRSNSNGYLKTSSNYIYQHLFPSLQFSPIFNVTFWISTLCACFSNRHRIRTCIPSFPLWLSQDMYFIVSSMHPRSCILRISSASRFVSLIFPDSSMVLSCMKTVPDASFSCEVINRISPLETSSYYHGCPVSSAPAFTAVFRPNSC